MNLNSQQIVQNFQILKNGLGLSDRIIDQAKLVIRDASENGLVRGYKNESDGEIIDKLNLPCGLKWACKPRFYDGPITMYEIWRYS